MTAEPRDGRVLHTGDTASPEPVPVDADPDQDAGAPLPLWQAYGRQQARQRRRRIAALGVLLLSQLGLAGYIVRAMQPGPPVPALPRTAAAPAADTLPMTAIDAPLVAEADPPPPPQDTPDAAGTGPTDGMDDPDAEETDADVPDAAPPAPPARLRLRIQPDGGRLISHADTPVPPPRPAAPIDPRLAPARQASADGDWARARSGWAALLAADPAQADHAYNLAVALDQRGERQEAIRHYRMALALADSRPARFPRAPTLRRLATLEEER